MKTFKLSALSKNWFEFPKKTKIIISILLALVVSVAVIAGITKHQKTIEAADTALNQQRQKKRALEEQNRLSNSSLSQPEIERSDRINQNKIEAKNNAGFFLQNNWRQAIDAQLQALGKDIAIVSFENTLRQENKALLNPWQFDCALIIEAKTENALGLVVQRLENTPLFSDVKLVSTRDAKRNSESFLIAELKWTITGSP